MNIIAEAGSNHNGNITKAFLLIDIAKNANCDSVKFQFIFPDGLYQEYVLQNDVIVKNPAFSRRVAEQLSDSDWKLIFEYAKDKNIQCFASVFDKRGIELLKSLGSTTVKIASTDFTNLELIESAILNFDNVILSTGMASLSEIHDTIKFVQSNRLTKNQVSIMHCVSSYPCSLGDSNLSRLLALRSVFDGDVGYSDHTLSTESAAIASFLGVRLFEKHFTFDRSSKGFDHKHAMMPNELEEYCNVIHSFQKSNKMPFDLASAELITAQRARRGVYAAVNIRKGDVIKRDMISYLRPSNGMSYSNFQSVIGSVATEDILLNEPLGINNTVIQSQNSDFKEAINFWISEMNEKGI